MSRSQAIVYYMKKFSFFPPTLLICSYVFYDSSVPRIFISSSLPMFIALLSNCFYKLLYTFVHSYIYFYTACVLSRFSHVRLLVNLWPVACHAPMSVGFSRQEYWSGLPCPSPGDLPNAGIKPTSLMSFALAEGFFTTSTLSDH